MNAYLNARFQRAAGIEADSFDLGAGYAIQTPYWEEGDFDPAFLPDHSRWWDWLRVPMRNGYVRPTWAKIVGGNEGPAWFNTQEDYQEWLDHKTGMDGVWLNRPILNAFTEHPWTSSSFSPPAPPVWGGDVASLPLGEAYHLPRWRAVREIANHYDLLALYGADAASGTRLDTPFVAFEHGTMRSVPGNDSTSAQLLARAYQRASHCIITNADCVKAAERLGLERYSFVPHPVDTEKFSPAPTDRSRALRRDLLEWSGAEILLLSPTRFSSDPLKGAKENRTLLEAYKRYVHEAEPNGAPKAHLLLAGWGGESTTAQRWCAELGIDQRVSWFPPLPKRCLADLYRAVDIVADQFWADCGSFGTITVEALATGKPVITYVDPAVHEWAFPELPPVQNALAVEDVTDTLIRLARSTGLRREIGAAGRKWVDAHHSPEVVTKKSLAVYEQALSHSTELVPA